MFCALIGGLVFALILGLVVAYMVLASQLNALLHPVTVLTIPRTPPAARLRRLIAAQT